MKLSRSLKTLLLVFGIPLIYALIIRVFFGMELKNWDDYFSVMSTTFVFILPTVMGFLTVYLSNISKSKKIAYRIFAPWVSIFLFLLITILFAIEGWACWLMILPVFLLTSSIGGVAGGYLKNQWKNDKLKISLFVLLPFFIAPIENLIDSIPGEYEAYTFIDIDAPVEKIWNNVTKVNEIPKSEDTGYLSRILGFPRPVKAELNFEGVGAYRKAIFTNGLVFHESVTEYKDNEKMVFNIKAYPHEIPSATLDEHVVIGGDYFDVLNGTYKLEKLPNGMNRLHLYSKFELNTTFDFYAGLWAKWIMEDIQNNILRVEKRRAENNLKK